jgi:hypothetical protein
MVPRQNTKREKPEWGKIHLYKSIESSNTGPDYSSQFASFFTYNIIILLSHIYTGIFVCLKYHYFLKLHLHWQYLAYLGS